MSYCKAEKVLSGNMDKHWILFVLFTLFMHHCKCEKELRLLGLQPITGKAWPGGWTCLAPIQMAIDGINAHPDMLRGYNLTYEYVDNEVCYTYVTVICTMN